MRSVAEDLRVDQLAHERRMSPGERVALALRLGLRDVETHAKSQGMTRRDAALALRRERNAGRRPSGCAAE
jgi:hypothetical protein